MKRKLTVFVLLALLLSLFALPVCAEEGLWYVTDEADLLTDEEDLELEALLQGISEEHNVGVYLVTVGDYSSWGEGSVYEVTYGIYHEYTMGKGEERNGIMLLLSLADRDFATFVYGEDAEYAFSDYALQQLEEEFLPYFADNDWYEGFRAYATTCDEYLTKAGEGKPVEEGDGMLYLIVIGASFLIALIVVSILKAGMKNVRAGQEAKAYITRELNLTQRSDQFTHTTRTERKIEKSDSDSKAETGGGGHGRSGKF